MAQKKTPARQAGKRPAHHRPRPGQDKDRSREDVRHHPYVHPADHLPHTPQKKPQKPRHNPHAHPHREELGPHTGKPSPVRPAKQITRTGAKKKKSPLF